MTKIMMNKKRGFTLIELMIVVAIIAILAAIAYPSYQGAIRDSRRGMAQADLVELASDLERYYTTNNSYTGGGGLLTTGGPLFQFNVSPQEGDTAFYNLSVAIPSSTAFTLIAIPTGPQVGDFCGTMTLDSTGKVSAAVPGCW
jgi:type IV pilus assembly protein PilE